MNVGLLVGKGMKEIGVRTSEVHREGNVRLVVYNAVV